MLYIMGHFIQIIAEVANIFEQIEEKEWEKIKGGTWFSPG